MKKNIVLTILAATGLSASAASIHSGLINYWPLDGDGAEVANLQSGNTSTTVDTGTLVSPDPGAATFGGGLFGGGLVTQRSAGTAQNGRVEAADQGTDLDRTGLSVTISIWAQHDAADSQTGNWQGLIAHGEGDDYRIAKDGGGGNTNGAAYAGGTPDIRDVGGVNLYDGSWHHIVATTTAGGGTELFVDGVSRATNAGPASISNNGANVLWIGNNPQGGANRMWDGVVDDVAMWDRVLTPAEIAAIHTQGLAGNSLAQVVPEPSTALLGLLGALGLLRRRR